MYAIKYKARNGRWVYYKEDGYFPNLYWCKVAAQAYIGWMNKKQMCDPSARPVKVKIVEVK